MYGPRSELVAHLLASWPQIVSLRIYYRANGTLLTIGLAMFVARQPIAEVVARPRDNLALSLTARQPRPLGEVGLTLCFLTARQPRPLGEVVERKRA